MFIVLLNFGESLATKCMSLNNESCMIRPTLIDSKPITVSLDKCREVLMLLMTYLQKYVFWVKQKTNVEVFNAMIRIKNKKS